MKKTIFILLASILFLNLVSAAIVITQQPKTVYNFGEVVSIPVKIVASTNLNNYFYMELICDGKSLQITKDTVFLESGQEKDQTYMLPLTENFINDTIGNCNVNFSIIGEEPVLSDSFKISRSMNLTIIPSNKTYKPMEGIIVEGIAVKENLALVKGIVTLTIESVDLTNKIEILGVVADGKFSLNFSMPEKTKARTYNATISVEEKDIEEDKTNYGSTVYEITIVQVPTSLDLIVENQEADPETEVKVFSTLYDQAGEKINSKVKFQIRNENNKLLQETEVDTEEKLVIPIKRNEPPATWKVTSESNSLTKESSFTIKPKENLKTEIVNDTVVFTNLGNIRYTKPAVVKIGETPFEIQLDLGIDESVTYDLEAPEGDYPVEANGITGNAILTGRAIDVQKAGSFFHNTNVNYFVWGFILLILGLAVIILINRILKRKSFTYSRHSSHHHSSHSYMPSGKLPSDFTVVKSSVPTKGGLKILNNAETVISMKGDNQPTTAVCLKLKDSRLEDEGLRETMQKIINTAELNRVYTNKGLDSLIFLFVPSKTKTMQNEKPAINLANKIKEILNYHNKVYKQKTDFGISVESGNIIAKTAGSDLHFTSLGNFIISAKKLASTSSGDTLISDKVKNKTSGNIRTERTEIGHSVVDVKGQNQDNKKFLDDFKRRNMFR